LTSSLCCSAGGNRRLAYPVCHQTALELTNYSQAELTGLDALSLFAGIPENAADWGDGNFLFPAAAPGKRDSMIQRLIRRDQTQIIGRLWIKSLKSKEKLSLLLFEDSDSLSGITDQEGAKPFMEWSDAAFSKLQTRYDFQSGLDASAPGGWQFIGSRYPAGLPAQRRKNRRSSAWLALARLKCCQRLLDVLDLAY